MPNIRSLRLSFRARTGGFDRESLQWLLATLGVVASLAGLLQIALPPKSILLMPWSIAGMVCIGAGAGVVGRLTRRSISAEDPNGNWQVRITRGSILDHRPAVITTDTRRNFMRNQVAEASLIRQFLSSLPESEMHNVEIALQASSHQGEISAGDIYIVPADTPGTGVWLLACGSPTEEGTATTWTLLMKAYDSLWKSVRQNQVEEIWIPVIGAGFSRMSLSHSAVLLNLIMAFHAASVEKPVCRILNIVIPAKEFSMEELLLIRRILTALRYKMRL